MSEHDPRTPIPPAPTKFGGFKVVGLFLLGAIVFAFVFRACADGPDAIFGGRSDSAIVTDSTKAP
jgi:hypothetical protein